MSDTLAEIIAYKRDIVAANKAQCSRADLEKQAQDAPTPRGFARALRRTVERGKPALIAELKKASPSKGIIRAEFNVETLSQAYYAGGATCLSVLTDERYFQGHNSFLKQASQTVPLPILRKDFMVDTYQIPESRALGADCILLIMAALSDAQAIELEDAALALGMDVLLESHNRKELERALTHLRSPLMGINNRNLKTLAVDINTSVTLAPLIGADRVAICESGIATHADITAMRSNNMHCFLVGESLMRQDDVTHATKSLLGEATKK